LTSNSLHPIFGHQVNGPEILSAASYTIQKAHKYPVNCSADEFLNESFLTVKGKMNFFQRNPSRGWFYSAGRRGGQNFTKVVAKVSQEKCGKRKGKKNYNPRPINLDKDRILVQPNRSVVPSEFFS